ncbi:MAG: NAD(P)H-dependent oxidoreductase subunit E [Sulfuritalea sp.]|nr:NAD(P)H-dependent oxidoreductase subunit E [Sulfuritalea sp.]
MKNAIQSILERYGFDRTRLLDMLRDVDSAFGHLPEEALPLLEAGLGLSRADIRETASFYHFFHQEPTGKHRIYLSNSVVAKMNGFHAVRAALERETGVRFGQTDPRPGLFSLFETACIGLSDQEPAMLIDHVAFTRLRPGKVADIIAQLRQGRSPDEIANPTGLPDNDVAYVDALVESNIRTKGPVFFRGKTDFRALLEQCLSTRPEQVAHTIQKSGLRGRGGAGFLIGLKWSLCRGSPDEPKYIICNADEGEPGTFKDRALLTRSPREVFMGMVIAAYAIGCRQGIVYLRAEYTYLANYLNEQLRALEREGLLGRDIGGRKGFDFSIRIQLGAGAYVCGEESALIESCEGKRGTPRVKPPFPVQYGYLGKPTIVNNVETLASVTRIMAEGADWFKSLGTAGSAGTRLLCVSGDCGKPGIYEVEWGIALNEVLAMVDAKSAHAVQVSGPSGECVSAEKDGARKIAFEDLACNGAITIFNRERDLLEIVKEHMQFFVDESCGICVPCRVGNVALLEKIQRVIDGKACQNDLDDMVRWGGIIRKTSRCGLGGSSPKPILTTLEKFPEIYRRKLVEQDGPLLPSFDVQAAVAGYAQTKKDLEREVEA